MELFGSNNYLANWFRRRSADTSAEGAKPESTSEKANQNSDVRGGSFAQRIVYVDTPNEALSVSAVYRAIELKMGTFAVMPVMYLKRNFQANCYEVDMKGLGKRINYLLHQEPNPLITAPEMWKLVTYNQTMTGNGFVYIERDEFGFPRYLWLVRSGSFNTETGLYNFIQYYTDHGLEQKTKVRQADVMHFANNYRCSNGFWGISTLQFAAETLSLNRTIRNQSLETAAKGGKVKLLIGEQKPATAQGTLAFGMYNKDVEQNYAKELQEKMYAGQDILAIRGIDNVQNISMTSQEMQAAETLGLTYDDVARFYGTPRPLLMLDSNSHYNDYQNATMEYHTRTILPEKIAREKEIARKLIGFNGFGNYDIVIDEHPLMTMDPERQAKVDLLHLQTGNCTVNEIRRQHNMPAVEGGDRVFRTANVKGLDEDGEGTTELKPGNYTVKETNNDENNNENNND